MYLKYCQFNKIGQLHVSITIVDLVKWSDGWNWQVMNSKNVLELMPYMYSFDYYQLNMFRPESSIWNLGQRSEYMHQAMSIS